MSDAQITVPSRDLNGDELADTLHKLMCHDDVPGICPYHLLPQYDREGRRRKHIDGYLQLADKLRREYPEVYVMDLLTTLVLERPL